MTACGNCTFNWILTFKMSLLCLLIELKLMSHSILYHLWSADLSKILLIDFIITYLLSIFTFHLSYFVYLFSIFFSIIFANILISQYWMLNVSQTAAYEIALVHLPVHPPVTKFSQDYFISFF